jgi:hypothetical protein
MIAIDSPCPAAHVEIFPRKAALTVHLPLGECNIRTATHVFSASHRSNGHVGVLRGLGHLEIVTTILIAKGNMSSINSETIHIALVRVLFTNKERSPSNHFIHTLSFF